MVLHGLERIGPPGFHVLAAELLLFLAEILQRKLRNPGTKACIESP